MNIHLKFTFIQCENKPMYLTYTFFKITKLFITQELPLMIYTDSSNQYTGSFQFLTVSDLKNNRKAEK